ncbi:hypothetical protein Bhyg_13287 [Pseudolycoriella hygida]|uniref:NADH dehydrogenase [ubiquinone] flavoprotein 3, mitochondrial n=1 Tax=Pseudolycoriella hygida TaxID=35572 RepID=A0A9Q0MP98_9DIPT|nr:hypothetical protein Bhyg_13287 [Pseudolycoriella hygida]
MLNRTENGLMKDNYFIAVMWLSSINYLAVACRDWYKPQDFDKIITNITNAAPNKPGTTVKSAGQPSLSATGLSERCVKSKKEPVGPGASSTGNYKVPEYFCYDKTSYAEAEIEMAKYRCPQPSAR